MHSIIFKKFNNYIYNPDLANKFILSSHKQLISSYKFIIYLKYIFSQRNNYSYIALKALIMMSSIYPKRCHMTSRIIILKYTKSRCHSIVYLPLFFNDYTSLLAYYMKRPAEMNIIMNGHIKEAKYFSFPGFIKHLRLPHWERLVNISFNQFNKNNLYPLFFHKTAFID